MYNLPDYYRAEFDYRREVLVREWRPIRARRAARNSVRNQIDGSN